MKLNSILKAIVLTIGFISISQTAIAQDIERREINPPKLDAYNLGQRILCHRPMRQGTPAMSVEVVDGKTIVNDYGHGGSGWTLAPGAAKYVIDLALNKSDTQLLNKQTPIAVVGAGAIGLFTSLELINQGYTNITIYADKFDSLTSHNAGGLLAPVSMDNDPQLQKIIDQIGIDAYIFYRDIALNKNKQISSGAIIVPTYFSTREDSGLEPYVGKVMQPAKDVIVDFKNGTTHEMVVYDDGIFMDTGYLMDSLTKVLKNHKVKFVKQKINKLTELSQNLIFNCTGAGAEQLSQDAKMISVQGHLIMLKNENPKDVNYMMLVYFGKDKTKYNQDIKRSFYFFPKKSLGAKPGDVGVIGGTFIENADSSTPNIEEFDILLKAAKKFYGLTTD
jgi:hypothetical protein